VLVAAHGLTRAASARGATDLRLAPGLSFTDDSSDDFPVRGEDMEDAELRPGRATVMFFGASHCWNTNREAERLVALYPKYRDRVHFIIVDVNRPSTAQRPLMKSYSGARSRRSSFSRRMANPSTHGQGRRRGRAATPGVWMP